MLDRTGFDLTESECGRLPSEEDVQFYEEHGWFVAPRLFDEADVAEAITAVKAHQGGRRDAAAPTALNLIDDWREGSSYRIRLNDYVALTNERLAALLRRPLIAAVAARLARTEEIRLWQSGIVYKEPLVDGAAVTIGWHTDRAYWRSCTSTRMLTAWIALQDCDDLMGPVTMIDGSHLWPDTEAVRAVRYGRTFLGTDSAELRRRLARTGMPVTTVPMNLRKGQVSFHNCLTVHGSGPNLSERPRIGLTAHFQDGENRYQRAYDESGTLQTHNNDLACRKLPNGDVDYSDPDICPVLWRTTNARTPVAARHTLNVSTNHQEPQRE
ncbi:phytanoyl-CoA dioxygenase family protein [Dactylosporangium sp. CA-092794]|uniref:phytanoyl-CoA dioxygenase family protein n=1 Tax=Dactylosporangium sp. CA-092794 TaxID=3239929 RepID=UPI003D93F7EC